MSHPFTSTASSPLSMRRREQTALETSVAGKLPGRRGLWRPGGPGPSVEAGGGIGDALLGAGERGARSQALRVVHRLGIAHLMSYGGLRGFQRGSSGDA